MMQVIPQLDCRLGEIVLVAKRAQAGGAQQETFSRLRFEPKPPSGKDPEKMTARKNQNIPLDGAHALNHAIGPCPNLDGGFPSGATIAKDLPAGAPGMDLRRPEALVFAIVPFHQISVGFRLTAEAGKFAGPGRAAQRTCEYASEPTSSELFAELPCGELAVLGEGEIGQARMLARESPCSLTVSSEVNDRQRFTHGIGLQIVGQ